MNQKTTLPPIGDKTPFKVPAGYFEGLTARLNQLIEQDREDNVQTLPRHSSTTLWTVRYRPVLYLAAMFVLLLFSVTSLLRWTTGDDRSDKLTKESHSTSIPADLTAEDYILSHIGTDGIAEYYIDPDMYD